MKQGQRILTFFVIVLSLICAYQLHGTGAVVLAASSEGCFPICTVAGDQAFAQTAYNSKDNEFLIVWQDFRAYGAGAQINAPGLAYGQRVSIMGELMGTEIPISVDEPKILRMLPVPAYDSIHNEYLVVYNENNDIYGRFVKGDGSPRGEEFTICVQPESQMHPAVLYNPKQQNFFILWNDSRKGKGQADIYGVFIDSNGNPAGDEFLVCDAPNDQIYPQMVYNPKQDQFLVTWEDFRYCKTDPCYLDTCSIYGKIFSSDGTPLSDTLIIADEGVDDRQQKIAYNPNRNEYLVVWNDRRNEHDAPNVDIYGRRIKGDGTLLNDFPVSDFQGSQSYCSIVYAEKERMYLAVWSDYRTIAPAGMQTLGYNVIYDPGTIFGRWFNEDIEPQGSEFMICEEGMGKQMLALTSYYKTKDNEEKIFVVWSDMRKSATGRDVYGKFIEPETCPATLMLGDEQSLNLLRLFRDTVLAKSALGKKYIDIYYQHAAEVSSLINADASLRHAAKAALLALLPAVQSMLQEKSLHVPEDKKSCIESLLNQCAKKASPALKSAIENVARDIRRY
jgi:hypothetical protein